jgi:hypothetical protein
MPADFDPQDPPRPRRFIYRRAEPDAVPAHPLRRSADAPRPFQAAPGQHRPQLQVMKFRLYLKLN